MRKNELLKAIVLLCITLVLLTLTILIGTYLSYADTTNSVYVLAVIGDIVCGVLTLVAGGMAIGHLFSWLDKIL